MRTLRGLEYFEEEYGVSLQDVDLQNEMIVVSHNAELEDMDYNLRESTYKSRGHYIGFAHFGKRAPNTVILYKTQNVPFFIQDEGGFPPDYDGLYR